MSYSTIVHKYVLSVPAKRQQTLGLLLALVTLLATSDAHASGPRVAVKNRAKVAKRVRSGPERISFGVRRPNRQRTDDVVWPPKNPVPIGTVGPKLEPVNAKLRKSPVATRRPSSFRPNDLTVGKPDLVIRQAQISGAPKYRGDRLYVPYTLTVKNAGRGDANRPFKFGVRFGSGSHSSRPPRGAFGATASLRRNGQVLTVSQLRAGASRQLAVYILILDPAKHLRGKTLYLRCKVDAGTQSSDGAVAESNERNNWSAVDSIYLASQAVEHPRSPSLGIAHGYTLPGYEIVTAPDVVTGPSVRPGLPLMTRQPGDPVPQPTRAPRKGSRRR